MRLRQRRREFQQAAIEAERRFVAAAENGEDEGHPDYDVRPLSIPFTQLGLLCCAVGELFVCLRPAVPVSSILLSCCLPLLLSQNCESGAARFVCDSCLVLCAIRASHSCTTSLRPS